MSDALHTGVRLPIRVRRTIDGDGQKTVAHLVHCEARNRSRPLDDCANCLDCESVHIDPLEQDWWVACRRAGVHHPTLERALVLEGDRTPVLSVVGPRVVCVEPDTSIMLARELLLEPGLTGAPVVDSAGIVVGFVSRADLLRNAGPGGATRISQIMTTPAVTVSETSSIAEAAALMSLEGVDRLPVVNNAISGRVVGVVSALDLLAWFAGLSRKRDQAHRAGS